MTTRRRFYPLLAISIVTATMGLIAFTGVASNSHFETYRTVDVIRLMAAGGNFTVALITLVFFFVRPNFRSEEKTPKG